MIGVKNQQFIRDAPRRDLGVLSGKGRVSACTIGAPVVREKFCDQNLGDWQHLRIHRVRRINSSTNGKKDKW